MTSDDFNAFGLSLFRLLSEEEVLFLSPLSIAIALTAARLGAAGSTEQELARLLGGADATRELAEEVSRLVESLVTRHEVQGHYDPDAGTLEKQETEVFRLNLANALFVMLDYPLLESYVGLLKKHFSAEVSPTNYAEPETAAGEINAWVSEHTEAKITSLIDPSAIQPDSKLILVNAVYFMARWPEPFEEELTEPAPFYLLPDSGAHTVEVDMMRLNSDFRYMQDEGQSFAALEIPYRAMSMLVILPEQGQFWTVESSLDPARLDRVLDSLEEHPVHLQFPRFQMETSLELGRYLQELGLEDAFNADKADFSGITSDPQGLVLSEVIHQARIRVDEQGTEAVAATAIGWLAAGIEEDPVETVHFVVDRPFLFLIRDQETGTILFLGRVLNPVA
jgi:serpin B